MVTLPFYLHHLAILGTFTRTLRVDGEFLRIEANGIPGPEWNYLAPLSETAMNSVVKGAVAFSGLYVPSPILNPSISAYLKENCTLVFTDAWMRFKDKPAIRGTGSLSIKEALTVSDMKIFIHVFERAFGGSEPYEPYGKLPPEYAIAILESFASSMTAFAHFIAYSKDEQPVGCASLSIVRNYAFFYCLGVLPEYRRRGFAQQLQMFRVKYALKKGCTGIYLQTAKDSVNEIMNQKLGFETAFTSSCYVRKDQ